MKRKTCAGARLARHVLLSPRAMSDARRTVSNARAAIVDRNAAACSRAGPTHAALQHGGLRDELVALVFEHICVQT
jgi:hypothetical protein